MLYILIKQLLNSSRACLYGGELSRYKRAGSVALLFHAFIWQFSSRLSRWNLTLIDMFTWKFEKIKNVFPSTHTHFNIFHPGWWVFTWDNLNPTHRILARLKRDPAYRASSLVQINEKKTKRKITIKWLRSRLPGYPCRLLGWLASHINSPLMRSAR